MSAGSCTVESGERYVRDQWLSEVPHGMLKTGRDRHTPQRILLSLLLLPLSRDFQFSEDTCCTDAGISATTTTPTTAASVSITSIVPAPIIATISTTVNVTDTNTRIGMCFVGV